MYLNYIVFSVFLIFSITSLVILFFIAAFLVRFRIDLINLINYLNDSAPKTQELEESNLAKSKTWDQKYEDDLDLISQRIRQGNAGEL